VQDLYLDHLHFFSLGLMMVVMMAVMMGMMVVMMVGMLE
jgi:hypothetical protein